jgi:hypothetical membrane protein
MSAVDRPTAGRLWAGPLAFALFAVGTTVLALRLPGYSQMAQTVSELGTASSPLRVPFAALMIAVGICQWVLASAVSRIARRHERSQLSAYLIRLSAVWSVGIAIFPIPDPLHAVFGYLGLIAMLSPIVFALSWRREPLARAAVIASWIPAVIVWGGIISFIFVQGSAALMAQAGLIQRVFLFSWMGWLAAIGILLQEADRRGEA